MLRTFNKRLERVLLVALAALFAVMICDVFLQVFARNVLKIPLVWTLDVAQLMFSWTIFIGAAVALRWNAHYHLDLLPVSWKRSNAVLRIFSNVAAICVVGVLLVNGWKFAEIGLNRISPAMEISEFWFFLPIPLGAAIMACFLLELVPDCLGAAANTFRQRQS